MIDRQHLATDIRHRIRVRKRMYENAIKRGDDVSAAMSLVAFDELRSLALSFDIEVESEEVFRAVCPRRHVIP